MRKHKWVLALTAVVTAFMLGMSLAPQAKADTGWAQFNWGYDSRYCLADPTAGGSGGSGTDVVLWGCQDGANFLWQQVQIQTGPYAGMFHLEVAQGGGLCLYDHGVQVNVRLQVVTCNDSWAGQAFLGNTQGDTSPFYPWGWFDPNEGGVQQYSVSMPFAPQNGAWVISDYRDDNDFAQWWDGPGTCFELEC